MCVKQIYVFVLLSGLAASGVLPVSGMKVSTHDDVEAVNGTDVRLKCTFQSTAPINHATLTISWSFRPLSPGREESVFYFHDKPFPPLEGRFRKRAVWAGDIMGRDASILIREVKFTYNGTFTCQVKNPPDVHGNAGEVRLQVVSTASISEIVKLAIYIACGILGVVLLLVVIVSIRRCRKKDRQEDSEEVPRRERKDPTVCHPLRSAHLYVDEEEYEIDSDDGMISEASTKDPSSSEEDERSTDEDRDDSD